MNHVFDDQTQKQAEIQVWETILRCICVTAAHADKPPSSTDEKQIHATLQGHVAQFSANGWQRSRSR